MSFKEFDLSEYISALEDFKSNQTEEIIKYCGSIKNFDMFVPKIKDDEVEVAKLAFKQFGSVEKYTNAMKYNLEHFSEIMGKQLSEDAKEIAKQSDVLYGKLTADLSAFPGFHPLLELFTYYCRTSKKSSLAYFIPMPFKTSVVVLLVFINSKSHLSYGKI